MTADQQGKSFAAFAIIISFKKTVRTFGDITGDVFNISVKDLAVLYEYWCFIKLNGLMKDRYELISQDIVGGRGTGKSMFFLCNSWREQYAAIEESSDSPNITQIGNVFFENEKWNVVFSGNTCKERMLSGKWVESIKPVSSVEKKDVETIFRGSVSSAFFSKTGEKILHCSSIFENEVWRPSQYFCEGILDINRKYAQDGDILINRIGKNAGYWSKYHGEKQLVSDCIIVVRGKSDLESFLKMHSDHGRLIVPVKGVATKYISIKDIVDCYFVSAK